MNFSHLNEKNKPIMVDVSTKQITKRLAIASGKITMNKEAYLAVINQSAKKGAVINTAIVAAIMGAKKTSDIIPMCHPLNLTKVEVDISANEKEYSFTLQASASLDGKTGVEMEALSAVSIGLLTMYDMLKAIDKTMIISDIKLLQKEGGKSGQFKRD
ncbi:cyclic pyranopterin monophosphate synthase MoaC [Campylobacter canadensis]|uniref:cyclic pyranopterin monophosphate synthase MoaC n=1 Tax=Campylobacter canadensis TaxID=449520 RepID=UPI0015530B59|nr:cyclic pyranopterin monophosphate synthase MoaC [Campylobacter canadensis]MBZ7995366.1 cyclic pyranopterin monophosphate synthase MoaC [Campylobacter canadensis]MBZ7996750.1 cyclic pyranopterin monophosphate synthase MoaC [Campylobacter canadensis]MBZ8000730.1 cyclic pyranopterin monophosphate synthase MoaC [Campylobacter canadensis]MBZ8002017.1 cyclic pyranopterin monophosphate synthase MoaC [Campylobacter canadensis]MBZ8004529.1 cyclic pyranopterin monophosphate synthase MoaC [Campylobact